MVFQRLFKSRFLSPGADKAAAEALYTAIVAQARHPHLYVELGVADDIDGRFEAVVLHMHLVLRRLGQDKSGAAVAQALFDAMFHDMDRSLRAIGVGDMSVGKKVKQMGAAFYGRVGSYEAALSSGDRTALADALARNVSGGGQMSETQAMAMAVYVERQVDALAEQPVSDLISGRVRFVEPEANETLGPGRIDESTA
ncbi:MAG: ubiquinol-cytochrome C chaperone [Alphaproteobacteria bacterium]|nr:ubiquinol-cytochrome C chaperone [Alphaproteobacteria bacterium]